MPLLNCFVFCVSLQWITLSLNRLLFCLPLSILEFVCCVFACVRFPYAESYNKHKHVVGFSSVTAHAHLIMFRFIFLANSCTSFCFCISLVVLQKGATIFFLCNHYQQIYKFYKLSARRHMRKISNLRFVRVL